MCLCFRRENSRDRGERGFSLVEVVLVVALISVLAGTFILIDPSFIVKNDVEVSSAVVTESLRRARTLSTASEGDSAWGVHIETSRVIVFKGDSFSGRDTSFDEEIAIPSAVSASGINDVVFGKLRGDPSVTGQITLSSDDGYSVVIEVNEKGAILH
jgi:prepilin-type N-terminal cleavage/methylation domain-containing protein